MWFWGNLLDVQRLENAVWRLWPREQRCGKLIQLRCFGVKVKTPATATGAEFLTAGRGSRGTVYYRMKAKKPRKTLALSRWLSPLLFGHVWATAATVSPFAIQFKHGTVEKTVLLDVVGYKRPWGRCFLAILEEGVTMVLHNNYISKTYSLHNIHLVVSMLYFVSSWIQSHFRIDFLQVQRLLHKQDLPVA